VPEQQREQGGIGKLDYFVKWYEDRLADHKKSVDCYVTALQEAFLAGWKFGFERGRLEEEDLPL
jgi:hypothetical protein